MNKSYLPAEVKGIDSDDPNGTFEAVLSVPTEDRDGEVIDPRAFEPLPDRISIDIDHGLSTATTVGSGRPYYDGNTLKIKGTFSSIPRAQEVRTLVTEGHIRQMSVAFMNAVREKKDGKTHVRKGELLNAAFVAVPSNREALVLAAKSSHRTRTRKQIEDEWLRARALLVAAEAELACIPIESRSWTRHWAQAFTLVMRGKRYVKELEAELKNAS